MNWLTLACVPTLVAALYAYIGKRLKKQKTETDALRDGLQALLRDRLYNIYNYCREKGSATAEEKEHFEALYIAYHNLGGNGVMTATRQKMLEL